LLRYKSYYCTPELPLISTLIKYLCVVVLCACQVAGIGQSVSLWPDYSPKDIHVNRRIARHPQSLANHLTKGKTSEKEKFDAIFAWVASNIRYDFSTYYSSGGHSVQRVKRLLKYRSGICMDYAFLMDTLCRLSGITNVSVPGYAKDEIFDVGDSLYLDNHAWNAVKLDGLWYVYDVTWASGRPEYHFTKFTNFIFGLLKKYPPRYRVKRVIIRKQVFGSYCDPDGTFKPPDTITYYKQRFWNRLLIRKLHQFRPKVERYTTQRIDTSFYLCNPETFAVTHFPDDPVWALVAGRTIRDYEGDSAYYHFHDSLYHVQQRYGRPCPGCDAFLAYDELNKNISLRKEGLLFNRRNRFASMICEYNIGTLKLIESRNVEDSLGKVTLIDTAMAWEERARASLYQSALNIEQDFYLQRNKNGHKADLLFAENTAFANFLRGEKFNIKVQSKSVKDLQRKTTQVQSQLTRRLGRVKSWSDKEKPNARVKNTPAKLLELQNKLRRADSLVSSDNRRIDSLRALLEKTIRQLSANLKLKLLEHDSVFSLFSASARLRYYMRDNYKKDIVELRKSINASQNRYMNDLEMMIYKPSAQCGELSEQLFSAIASRNKAEEEAFVWRSELTRRSQKDPEELNTAKKSAIDLNRSELCWFEKNAPALDALFRMFGQFTSRQADAMAMIRMENGVEVYRERKVNKELARRKKKYKKIVLHNTKATNYLLRITRKEKRMFLKKLRDERREAAKRQK